MDWDKEIRENSEVALSTKDLIANGCPATDIKFSTQWIGTAPFCGGHSASCESHEGRYFIASDASGDGDKCWTGKKILCAKPVCSKWDAEFSDAFDKTVIGTSPLCHGTPCDCFEQGAIPWKSTGSYTGKVGCVVGEYQICLKPNSAIPAALQETYAAQVAAGLKVCQQREKMDATFLQEGIDILNKVANAISKK
jgi:hypothetical protein